MSNDSDDAKTIAKIKLLIKNPPQCSVVLTITKKVAEFLLTLNKQNRTKKPDRIAEYKRYMNDGDWKMTGDTVKISTIPSLLDGQNRLFACVLSDKPFITHVVFGIDPNVFAWMDRTKTRNNDDVLHLIGVKSSKDVAGMIRWLEMFRLDRVKERITIRPDQTIDAYQQQYKAPLIASAMIAARKVYAADKTPRSVAAALYYVFAEKNAQLAAEFFEAWATRNFGKRMRPIEKASACLAAHYATSLGHINDVLRVAVWVIAWNLVVNKHTGTKPNFEWRKDQPFPKIEG